MSEADISCGERSLGGCFCGLDHGWKGSCFRCGAGLRIRERRVRYDAFGQVGEGLEAARLVAVYSFPSGSYAAVQGVSRSRSESYGEHVGRVT